MFMPTDFVKIYDEHLLPFTMNPEDDFSYSFYEKLIDFPHGNATERKLFADPEEVTSEEWTPYWERIVEVFSVIKSNPHNFHMDMWHCGTSHCIAGWAQFLYTKTQDSDTAGYVGENYLSPLMRPFFHVVEHLFDSDENIIMTAEDAIMQYLIDPVLEEARKDGIIPMNSPIRQTCSVS
jgi:hypothetical protein